MTKAAITKLYRAKTTEELKAALVYTAQRMDRGEIFARHAEVIENLLNERGA